ncbi:MAG TPA: dienelactone hydrolase family protein [Opitutaceae bacterium]|nr:dienelactone hydrolase family protein [Opitutaceae bacterium]
MKISLVLFLLSAAAAFGQPAAKARLEKSPRHLEWVKVKYGNREVACFIAYPEVKDRAPAVVVIHEIFGLTDWARSVADQLAAHGYIAVAPDLLSGMAPGGGGTAEFGGRDAVTKAVMSLSADQVTADLNAAASYVAGLPACNGKVSVAGFCWGGSQSFRYVTNNPHLQAAFVFYGTGPEQAEAIARIANPVYGFYGGNDARVGATLPKTTELMKAAGKTFEPVIYDGAGHGFMRAGEEADASPANRQAMTEGWKRWLDLLAKINGG